MSDKLRFADRIIIFTDGSCTKNPGGDGAWSVLIYTDPTHSITINGYDPSTTNQRMELTAVNSAMEFFKTRKKLIIYTDSMYVRNCHLQKWYANWQKNGWKNSKGDAVANKDLWEKFIRLITFHDVIIKFVKGHSSNPFNNSCDEMACEMVKFHRKMDRYVEKGGVNFEY